VDWKLEVVTIPVSDLDRAKALYAEHPGFNVDIDHKISDEVRFLQLTAPGSACSIHLGPESAGMTPGHLSVLGCPRRTPARDQLVERGVEVTEVRVFESGSYRPSREGESLDLVECVFFSDPDGNRRTVQQMAARH
jgi:catechol 2,3-dioxygenase-like lactoylglutathione lyase family enzyme